MFSFICSYFIKKMFSIFSQRRKKEVVFRRVKAVFQQARVVCDGSICVQDDFDFHGRFTICYALLWNILVVYIWHLFSACIFLRYEGRKCFEGSKNELIYIYIYI